MAKKTINTKTDSIFDLVSSIDESAEILAESKTAVISDYIDTGSYILNAAMTGSMFKGAPCGRVLTLAGAPGCLEKNEKVEIYIINGVSTNHKKREIITLTREIIINDLKNYYTDEEFIERTGFDFDNIDDKELVYFFNHHCQKHKIVVSAQTLYDHFGNATFVINTPDGFKEVGELYKKGVKPIYTIETSDHSIKCSDDHLIQTPTKWEYAKNLHKGDLILTKDGFQEINYIREGKESEVYDLEVLYDEHRYWGGTGICSHNSGKSYLALSICRNAQKKGYIPVYMDSESAIDKDFVERLGCDSKNFIIKQVTTISEVSTFVANFCQRLLAMPEKDRYKVIFVLDSLGNLTSTKEFTDTIEGNSKRDMTKQQEIKALFRTNATALGKIGALFVVNSHTYSTQDLFSKQVVSGGSGIAYNSSVTMLLSTSKLEDKDSDKVVEKKVGEFMKTGVVVTARPEKSRFTIPQKVKFQIPFFKAPNPYVGLEAYLTWENSGVLRGKMLSEKEFEKLSAAEQANCYPMTSAEGKPAYAYPKDTSKYIVVKHLGSELPLQELFTSKVFTDELLHYLDDTVIRPSFELPSHMQNDDVEELVELDLDLGSVE